jgi:hypothetical protein
MWSKNNKTQVGIDLSFIIKDRKKICIDIKNTDKFFYKEKVLYNGKTERAFTLQTGMIECLDIEKPGRVILREYTKNNLIIDELMCRHRIEVIFCIIIVIEKDKKPAIYIEKALKNLIMKLNASIHIDYYHISAFDCCD